MKILAIDTSTNLGSVALVRDGRIAAEVSGMVRARHGETLLPHVERVLVVASEEIAAVDLIAVGIGPGSFTGLRVGVATAKGLAMASGRPICGVVSLRAIAAAQGQGVNAAVVDAHKGEVYAALYHHEGLLGTRVVMEPVHGVPAEVAARLKSVTGGRPLGIAGSGYRKYASVFDGALGDSLAAASLIMDHPRAAYIAMEGEQALRERGEDEAATLEPLYVRPSDAMLPSGSAKG